MKNPTAVAHFCEKIRARATPEVLTRRMLLGLDTEPTRPQNMNIFFFLIFFLYQKNTLLEALAIFLQGYKSKRKRHKTKRKPPIGGAWCVVCLLYLCEKNRHKTT